MKSIFAVTTFIVDPEYPEQGYQPATIGYFESFKDAEDFCDEYTGEHKWLTVQKVWRKIE